MMPGPAPFLTAWWLDLVLLNYEVPEGLLAPLVPAATELEPFDDRLLVSLVGFRFVDTRVRGWAVPFHRTFEEVNLRFYVRRLAGPGDWRRGVVFVQELVPRRAIAWLARLLYNEPYRRASMEHRIDRSAGGAHPESLEYRWTLGGASYLLEGRLAGAPGPLERPSEAEFVTEHYWGYTRQRDGGTLEYRVAHPAWTVAQLANPAFRGDVARLYGPAWAGVLGTAPRSASYATGSAVEVFSGTRVRSAPAAAERR